MQFFHVADKGITISVAGIKSHGRLSLEAPPPSPSDLKPAGVLLPPPA